MKKCKEEKWEEIKTDALADNNEEWKAVMKKELQNAKNFEIHIWNEEEKELSMALKFGKIKNDNWEYGKVIEGRVTEEFKKFIISLKKPSEEEVYNKMTPFFTIFLDNSFCSSHYGLELSKKVS